MPFQKKAPRRIFGEPNRELRKPVDAGQMSAHRYRFRWRADGADCDTVIETTSYPLACCKLALFQMVLWKGQVPADFEMDLRMPEVVEWAR